MVLSREDAYLILNALPRVGWVTLQRLLQNFGNDPQAILNGTEADFKRVGITAAACANLCQWRSLFDPTAEKSA